VGQMCDGGGDDVAASGVLDGHGNARGQGRPHAATVHTTPRHRALVGAVLGIAAARAAGMVVSVLYSVLAEHNRPSGRRERAAGRFTGDPNNLPHSDEMPHSQLHTPAPVR
jgi:hypothetical protein